MSIAMFVSLSLPPLRFDWLDLLQQFAGGSNSQSPRPKRAPKRACLANRGVVPGGSAPFRFLSEVAKGF